MASAFFAAQDELLAGGEYHPLRGSQSFVAQPHGMSQVMEQRLKAGPLLLAASSAGEGYLFHLLTNHTVDGRNPALGNYCCWVFTGKSSF